MTASGGVFPDQDSARRLLVTYLYEGRPPDDAAIVIRGPIYSGYNSRVFKVFCARLPFPCALKVCLQPRSPERDPETAHQQFATLTKVANALPDNGRYRVPQPYLLMEPEGALLMRWLVGKSLSDILFAFAVSERRAQDLLKDAAGWLRTFHAAGPSVPQALDTAEKLDNLRSLQRRSKIFDRCHGLLADFADAASSFVLLQGWVSGDFKSDNLIFSDDGVFGLDIHAAGDGITLYDVAGFLNHIDLNLNCWSRPRLWSCRRRLFRHFVASYLDGSEADADRIDLPLSWVRLYMLLSSWSTVHTDMQGSLHGRVLERQYAAAAARVAQELGASLRPLAPAID